MNMEKMSAGTSVHHGELRDMKTFHEKLSEPVREKEKSYCGGCVLTTILEGARKTIGIGYEGSFVK